jgi:hypothetical protein
MAAALAACDETFEPIAPSALGFSVFGYLDASADTQWIRVMPIRPLRTTSAAPLDAQVTLEVLATGRIIELRDSVFRFSLYSDPDLGAEGVYVHNYWTPEPIEPGASYRFSATLEGKEPAEAVVEIPRDFDVEVAIDQGRNRSDADSLRVMGVKHLPFVTTIAHYADSCGTGATTSPNRPSSADDGVHLMAIQPPPVTERPGCGPFLVENRALWIVGSAVAWPAGGYSPVALGDSGWTSNVTNAVGFLGGVLTKAIPYEDCRFETQGAPVPEYCRLRYNRETATVTGTVREPLCYGLLDSVTVRLTELGRDPARVRTVLTTRAGEFLIGALEPGIPHALSVRAPQVPIDSVFDTRAWRYVYTEWTDVHTLHTDTLTLMPGQRLEYAIQLARLFPCGAGTLFGTVTETLCGDGPIDSATLELTELNVTPPDNPRTHIGRTNGNGEFLITGLRPQFMHFLRVRGPDTVVDSVYNPETGRWDPVLENVYSERIDYLRFLRDQVVKYDVWLGRLTSCSEPAPGAP